MIECISFWTTLDALLYSDILSLCQNSTTSIYRWRSRGGLRNFALKHRFKQQYLALFLLFSRLERLQFRSQFNQHSALLCKSQHQGTKTAFCNQISQYDLRVLRPSTYSNKNPFLAQSTTRPSKPRPLPSRKSHPLLPIHQHTPPLAPPASLSRNCRLEIASRILQNLIIETSRLQPHRGDPSLFRFLQ